MDPIYFENAADFYVWLEQNHDRLSDQWVGFYKKHTGIPSMTIPEAMEQVLCFGWIDGLRKKIDEERFMIRFLKRKPTGRWSSANVKKVEELMALGLMHPVGIQAFENRKERSEVTRAYENKTIELPETYLEKIRENPRAWEYFVNMPKGYQRTSIYYVMQAKREETRLRRLNIFIESCEEGKKIPLLRRKGE